VDRPCRAGPIRSFVAHDRAADGSVPRVTRDETDGAGPRDRRSGRPDPALAEQLAADLLPEAGDSGAVEAEEGL
jgi:hypothetical protein